MLTAAIFTIARTWKQPKCPLTGAWIKKMYNIYIMDTTQNETGSSVQMWMKLESVLQSEVSQCKNTQADIQNRHVDMRVEERKAR